MRVHDDIAARRGLAAGHGSVELLTDQFSDHRQQHDGAANVARHTVAQAAGDQQAVQNA